MFGKRIQLIMQQLQKALTPRSFSQESFTTRKSLSWALLPGLGGLEGDTEAALVDALQAGTFDTWAADPHSLG